VSSSPDTLEGGESPVRSPPFDFERARSRIIADGSGRRRAGWVQYSVNFEEQELSRLRVLYDQRDCRKLSEQRS